jgi:hypothetical protein
LRPRSLLNIHIRPIPTTLELTISRNRFFASLPIISTINLCCIPLHTHVFLFVSLLALGSVPMPTIGKLCVVPSLRSVRRHTFPAHIFLVDSPGGRPRRKLAIGTFASVGQELLGIPSANEEMYSLVLAVVLPRSTEAVAVGAPMHDYSTAGPTSLRERQWRTIFLYKYDGLEPDLVPCRRHWRRSWRTSLCRRMARGSRPP